LKESINYSTLVITSHDQVFLDRISEQTICLRNQQLDYFDGTPSLMQSVEAEERVHKEKVVSALDKKREHVSPSSFKGSCHESSSNDKLTNRSKPRSRMEDG
jgi:ATPase subunit of ABC transporter with duplicated ATPase domains